MASAKSHHDGSQVDQGKGQIGDQSRVVGLLRNHTQQAEAEAFEVLLGL
jgi:hypothetical protein